jgi:hypothetical protein
MRSALHKAAQESEIDVPDQVSLPMSFTTLGAPAEAVAVFSGQARDLIASDEFASSDTDLQVDRRRALVPMSESSSPGEEQEERTEGVGWAIVRAVGLFVIGNMAAVTVAAISDRWPIFITGWPVELLLGGLAVCIVMAATSCVWLLIPAGILLANGLALSYSSLTGEWQHWRYLWPLELWFALLLVALTLWLYKRSDRGRRLSRWLGRALGWTAFTWSLLVAAAAIVA